MAIIKKTYESPNSVIANWMVMVNKRPRIISFTAITEYEGSRTGKGSMFTTDDEELQKAIEKSRLFGVRIKLWKVETDEVERVEGVEGVERVEAQAEIEPKEDKVISAKVVDSPNEAREYLNKHFGVEIRRLPNIKAIVNAAKERGIVFECLNK